MPCVYNTGRWSGGELPREPPRPLAGLVEWEGHMRSRIVRIRTSDTEFARMKDIATERGLSLSELVRRSTLGIHVPVRRLSHADAAVLVRTLGELGRIGGNLNQITRQINSGRLHGHDAELSHVLSDVDALRGRIREIIA